MLWQKRKIGDIAQINEQSYSEKLEWMSVNYLDTGNITANRIDTIQKIDLNKEKLPSRAKRLVRRNSILFSMVRPNQRHFGIIKEIPENFLVSTGFVVIDCDTKYVNPEFVYYFLIQDYVIEGLQAIAEQSVSAYPSIKPSDIEKLEIDIPPLTVQNKIVGILGEFDKKIETQERINHNLAA